MMIFLQIATNMVVCTIGAKPYSKNIQGSTGRGFVHWAGLSQLMKTIAHSPYFLMKMLVATTSTGLEQMLVDNSKKRVTPIGKAQILGHLIPVVLLRWEEDGLLIPGAILGSTRRINQSDSGPQAIMVPHIGFTGTLDTMKIVLEEGMDPGFTMKIA